MNKTLFSITYILAISNISMLAETTEPPRITDPEQLEAFKEATCGMTRYEKVATELTLINLARPRNSIIVGIKDGCLYEVMPSLGKFCDPVSPSMLREIIYKMLREHDSKIGLAYRRRISAHSSLWIIDPEQKAVIDSLPRPEDVEDIQNTLSVFCGGFFPEIKHILTPEFAPLVIEDGVLYDRYSRPERGKFKKLTQENVTTIVTEIIKDKDGKHRKAFEYNMDRLRHDPLFAYLVQTSYWSGDRYE